MSIKYHQTTSGISSWLLKNNVINWDDIPYAKPPIGDLRWKAPKKLDTKKLINILS